MLTRHSQLADKNVMNNLHKRQVDCHRSASSNATVSAPTRSTGAAIHSAFRPDRNDPLVRARCQILVGQDEGYRVCNRAGEWCHDDEGEGEASIGLTVRGVEREVCSMSPQR